MQAHIAAGRRHARGKLAAVDAQDRAAAASARQVTGFSAKLRRYGNLTGRMEGDLSRQRKVDLDSPPCYRPSRLSTLFWYGECRRGVILLVGFGCFLSV